MEDDTKTHENIVLAGFMGTGKSTVGRIVADRLGREFVDSDEVIEAEFGPVGRIFAIDGEAGFREKERTVALSLASRRGVVIATGGGMLLDPVAVEAFERHGSIFCLRADPTEILRRVLGDSQVDRPLLADSDPRARILELLAAREHAYSRFTQISTDHKTPHQVADEVCSLLPD